MQIKPIVSTALLLACLAPSAHAAGLPDTGQNLCGYLNLMDPCTSDNSGDAADTPRQDGRFGRDPHALGKNEVYSDAWYVTGFDYTRVCNSGELAGSGSCPADPALGYGPDEWACTLDNITGLMWEVKVNNTNHLRHRSWEYTWYDSNPATNGGGAGFADTGAGVGSDKCLDAARCDTEKYAADVNASALCGHSDWRLPQRRELRSILHLGWVDGSDTAIDITHFPDTWYSYWSASPYAPGSGAWKVSFLDGRDWVDSKVSGIPARLVRGGQF